uniref:(northern house mosquito) hypothetical protein n=1 Tax=Culex pipiens TaxID=7175 RepID=A0A8D8FFG6_CULPI
MIDIVVTRALEKRSDHDASSIPFQSLLSWVYANLNHSVWCWVIASDDHHEYDHDTAHVHSGRYFVSHKIYCSEWEFFRRLDPTLRFCSVLLFFARFRIHC